MKNFTTQSSTKSRANRDVPYIPASTRSLLPFVKGAPLSVLLVYWSRLNKESGLAWPSISTLAKDTGFSEDAVKNARAALVKMGLLVPVGQRKNADGKWGRKTFRVNTAGGKLPHGTAGEFYPSTAGGFCPPAAGVKLPQEGTPVEGTPVEGVEEKRTASASKFIRFAGKNKIPRDKRHPAWKDIGIEPVGSADFVFLVESLWDENSVELVSEFMERVIQRSQRIGMKVPPPFYAAKREVEKLEIRQRGDSFPTHEVPA